MLMPHFYANSKIIFCTLTGLSGRTHGTLVTNLKIHLWDYHLTFCTFSCSNQMVKRFWTVIFITDLWVAQTFDIPTLKNKCIPKPSQWFFHLSNLGLSVSVLFPSMNVGNQELTLDVFSFWIPCLWSRL